MCVHQQELMLLLWTADPSVWNVFLTLFYWFHHLPLLKVTSFIKACFMDDCYIYYEVQF